MEKETKEAWFKIFSTPALYEKIYQDSAGDYTIHCGRTPTIKCKDCVLNDSSCFVTEAVYVQIYNEYVLGNTTPVDDAPNLFKSMSVWDIDPEYNSDPMIHDNAKANLDALPDSDITVAENGWEKETKKDGKVKTMFQLVDPYFYEGFADILTLGAQKYKPNNWVDGSHDEYSRAVESHWNEYKKGNKLDKESGKSHLYHIACNLMFLDYFDRREL